MSRLPSDFNDEEDAEQKWHHEKFLEDRADEMRDREKDERAEREFQDDCREAMILDDIERNG